MAIATLAQLRKAARQTVVLRKAVVEGGTNQWYNSFRSATGDPAAALSLSNTTTGLVPQEGDAGIPSIVNFSGTGYISGIRYAPQQSGTPTGPQRVLLCDRLFHVGPFSAAGTTNLSSQPSYSGRLPTVGGNPDYTGLFIWLEGLAGVTPATAQVTYTNQDGTAGQTSGTASTSNTSNDTGGEIPLAAGDVGVKKIESVIMSGAGSIATCNIAVLRPLRWMCINDKINNGERIYGLGQGMPIVFPTTAFYLVFFGSQGSTFTPDMAIEIASA
jgi:hypothetical protein